MTTISRHLPPQALITFGNPAVRALLESPLHGALDGSLLVLHVVGRRTGRHYDIPVAYVDLDGRLVVTTQHRWRVNLRDGGDLDVTLRGERRRMHSALDEDPVSVGATLHHVLEALGVKAAHRLTGLTLPDGTATTVDHLREAAREFDLATVTLTQ